MWVQKKIAKIKWWRVLIEGVREKLQDLNFIHWTFFLCLLQSYCKYVHWSRMCMYVYMAAFKWHVYKCSDIVTRLTTLLFVLDESHKSCISFVFSIKAFVGYLFGKKIIAICTGLFELGYFFWIIEICPQICTTLLWDEDKRYW